MEDLKQEHPAIISASRRTDIPAFHSDWLINAFKKGRMVWKNPFNPEQKKYIHFDKTLLVVFWSKNPLQIIDKLDFFDNRGINYYFQYTLNHYPEYLEPGIPGLNDRIDMFRKIVDNSGKRNVVWRFDPIVLSDRINEKKIYDSILSIGKELKGYADRLMISFLQLYPKVNKRMKKAGGQYKKMSNEEKVDIFKTIGNIGSQLGLEVMSCAEPLNMNSELGSIGIKKGGCIDPEIIKGLFNTDEVLMKHLEKAKKDKGQRKECGCIESIDIGTYNTCKHHCLYCYANT